MARWIAESIRTAIYRRDNNTCVYCGKNCVKWSKQNEIERPSDLRTLDHIVPQKELKMVAEGCKDHFAALRTDPKNLVVACRGCNSKKQDTPLFVFCEKNNLNYHKILTKITTRINKPTIVK
jgi:5-methylcytosine-specific restriction endonuclease McrA